MMFQGKNVLITGASRGLGRALARQLAAQGARVVMVARGQAALDAAVEEIRGRGGVAYGLAADIGDKSAIHKISGFAAAMVGPIDILIHAASILGPTPLRYLLDTECEDLEQVLAVNLVGPFRLTKVIAGHMALVGSGVVLQLSSDAATSPYPGWGAYAASKSGADQLTRVWAEELKDRGVRFFSVDPGEMDTQMHRDALPEADPTTLAQPEAVAEVILQMLKDPTKAPSGAYLAAWRSL